MNEADLIAMACQWAGLRYRRNQLQLETSRRIPEPEEDPTEEAGYLEQQLNSIEDHYAELSLQDQAAFNNKVSQRFARMRR